MSFELLKVLFADGDASIFRSVTDLYANYYPDCDAVINIEFQPHLQHWVAAGESSIWTVSAVADFSQFAISIYKYHFKTLEVKARGGSSLVDMSILWLWWIANVKLNPTVWKLSVPFRPLMLPILDAGVNKHDIFSRVVEWAEKLDLPVVDRKLRICNGLNVRNRTVFDHMHAWQHGYNFSLNTNTDGIPSITALCRMDGGRPEETAMKSTLSLKALEEIKLKYHSLHYQGDSKLALPYDICRILMETGSKKINDPQVIKECEVQFSKYPGLPCAKHIEHHKIKIATTCF